MKLIRYSRIAGSLCAGTLASCAHHQIPHAQQIQHHKVKTRVSKSLASNQEASGVMYDKVNKYRQQQGRSALKRHAGLDKLAQQHCEYLRQNRGKFSLKGKYVSHMGFDGRATVARVQYQMETMSENVAAARQVGKDSSETILQLWKQSKDHHKNILDDWSYTGVGVVVDSDGMVFATQLFATAGAGAGNRPGIPRNRFTRF